MAIKGIDIYEVRDYVSKHDTAKDKKDKTIFKLGVLDTRIRAELEDETTSFEISSSDPEDKAKTTLGLNRLAIEAVRFGLKGVENLQDKDGKAVKFDTVSLARYGKNYQVVTPDILNMLPFKVITELAGEILKDNRLTEKEAKN